MNLPIKKKIEIKITILQDPLQIHLTIWLCLRKITDLDMFLIRNKFLIFLVKLSP